MSTPIPTDVIIYRMGEEGLEVFLMNQNPSEVSEAQRWQTPEAPEGVANQAIISQCIELEPTQNADGASRKAIAVEAEWYDIPSLRALIYEDYRVAKERAYEHLNNLMPDLEKGAFFAIKEAFKKIMPDQYAFLKELKDILTEKNTVKNI
ncbi:MAG: hypothetical protein ACK4NS_07685 [Saprospiraceae bacterium]